MRPINILLALATFTLSGCAAQRREEATLAVANSAETCKASYTPNTHYLDRTNCEAPFRRRAMQVNNVPPDLAELFLAKRAAIAARIDAGQITREQANVEVSTASVEINQIVQERNRSNTLAAAAIFSSMPRQQTYQVQPYVMQNKSTINTNCTTMGNMVNCTSY